MHLAWRKMSLGAKGEDWRIRLGMRLKLGGCGWIRGKKGDVLESVQLRMSLAAFMSRVVYVFELLVFQENVKKGKKRAKERKVKLCLKAAKSCE